MSKDIRDTGPSGEIVPPLGDNKEFHPGDGTAIVTQTYANKPWLTDQLVSLIATTNLLVDELEGELYKNALPVTTASVDVKLKEAVSAEWPKDLGPPKNIITYRYYKALELRDSSAAAYIRTRYEEAARDVTGLNAIDLVSLTKLIRNEAFLAQEFITTHVGQLDDSAEHRTVELLQDWVTSATDHTGKLRDLFKTRDEARQLPSSDVEQVTPDEARNSQALFKVNLNKLNNDLDNSLAFLKKNFQDYADVFYRNFLAPSLKLRTTVTRNIYPILPGRLGKEVNTAVSAVDNQLSLVLADQARRNMLFDQKMKELEIHIDLRDTYRSYIKQLAPKGKDLPTGAASTLVEATDTPEEVDVFDDMANQILTEPPSAQATPTGQFESPHSLLTDVDVPNAHPQYILKDGGIVTGNLAVSSGIRIDGVDIDKHEHSGSDGSPKIKGSNIEGGTLGPSAVDPSDSPNTPTNLRLESLKQNMVPPGVVAFDGTFSWQGDDGQQYELQIVPLRS